MHKNADIVRRGYQAFNTADIKTLTEIFDEKSSWHTPGRSSLAGARRPRGGLRSIRPVHAGDRRDVQGRIAARAR